MANTLENKLASEITLREHFAGLMMQGLAGTNRYLEENAAISAVRWADALLKELDK